MSSPRSDEIPEIARDWLIWSYEHNAWWGPNHCGYFTDLRAAGLYTEAEAKEVEQQANRGGDRNEQARHISTEAAAITYALEKYRELDAALRASRSSTVAVGGDHMGLSLAEFTRRCLVQIEAEQSKPNPDNALIGVLCEAVRLARESALRASQGGRPSLHDVAKDAAERAAKNSGAPPQLLYAPILWVLQEAFEASAPSEVVRATAPEPAE